MHCKLHKKQIDMLKKGDKVRTWTDTRIGTVVKYDKQTKEVTIKTKGRSGYDILQVECVQKV